MRLAKISGAALLALGAAAAALLWRNQGVREGARRMLIDTRARLREAGIPDRLNQWRTAVFDRRLGLTPGPEGVPGVLTAADEDLTTTQRVRTNLGREPALAELPHLNINTQENGVVYLRGYVHSAEQRRRAAEVAAGTPGVNEVINELNIEQAVNL